MFEAQSVAGYHAAVVQADSSQHMTDRWGSPDSLG
jgi:hypothetical protein